MKRLYSLVLAVILTAASLAGCTQAASGAAPSGLYISEVVSSNSSSLTDPVLGNPDWIELYNASGEMIDLSGYSIVASKNEFEFPDGASIEAGAYMIVYCCTATEDAGSQIYCTGFKLSKNGEQLVLSAPHGTLQRLSVPALEADISYGIGKDGSYQFFSCPTPGAANDAQGFSSIDEISGQIDASLKISEILPQSVSDSDPYGWIELTNTGSEPIDLSQYYITENLSNPKKAKLPKMTLEAGQYAVIRFTGSAGDAEVPFKIGSEETTVALLDVFGNVVDRITWDAASPAGISAGRSDNGNTVYYMRSTPGEANDTECLDSIAISDGAGDVIVDEILLKNSFSIIDEDGDRSPWVELFNTSDKTVNLSDYALSDNKDRLLKYRLPDAEIAPGGYALVYLSGKDRIGSELHANFKIGSDETQLFLTDIASCTVQTVDLPAQSKDNVSYGRTADGTWQYFPMPTPLAANSTQGFTEIAAAGGTSYLIISEVSSVSKAKDGQSDWIELYNGTQSDIDISGYYLSDSRKNLKKWQIGSASVSAGGYIKIDRFQNGDATDELHISLSGETVYLSNPQGLVLDQLNTGVLRPGISKGRLTSGETVTTAFFSTPTPGAANTADTISGYCNAPLFSVNGGYHSAPITLEITAKAGETVYYTLDGSTPSESSTPYTGPITISSTQTVRAIAAAPGKLSSNETVATYLFEEKHSLPVVCLSISESDKSYVFSSQERGDGKERAGYVEYYEADGTLGVRFPAGFRLAGAGTRQYPQKSINLYLRGGYGQSAVTYPFFEGYGITTFKSLSLRNMGQDQDNTRLRDVYFQMAVNGMNIDNMQSKFVVVYINGQYYGLYEFKENQNEDYLAAKHGIDADKVEMARNQWIFVGQQASINRVFSIARGNTASDEQFAKYTEIADSDYFMDYLIAIHFFNSSDYYNQKYAHTSDNTLKWRPLFYDLDLALGSASASNFGSIFSSTGILGPLHEDGKQYFFDMGLYYGFRKNQAWCDAFVKRYAQVLNTVLTTDKLLSLYDSLTDSIRSEMPRTIQKWGRPSSMSSWENNIRKLRSNIENRRHYAIKGLQSYFNLSDEKIAELFPNG